MHAVSKQRCAFVVGPTPSGAASPQRCAAAAARAEAPERRCPAGYRKPIDTIQPAKVLLLYSLPSPGEIVTICESKFGLALPLIW